MKCIQYPMYRKGKFISTNTSILIDDKQKKENTQQIEHSLEAFSWTFITARINKGHPWPDAIQWNTH